MAPRKKKRRNGNNTTGTVMKFVRLGALGAPAIQAATSQNTWENKLKLIISRYTGYWMDDGSFRLTGPDSLASGWTPYIAASFVTRIVPKINKILRSI